MRDMGSVYLVDDDPGDPATRFRVRVTDASLAEAREAQVRMRVVVLVWQLFGEGCWKAVLERQLAEAREARVGLVAASWRAASRPKPACHQRHLICPCSPVHCCRPSCAATCAATAGAP